MLRKETVAPNFISENFRPDDRLAVVLVNKRSQEVIQRITTAENMAGAEVQDWLRHKNAERFEVYLSMNALKESAEGRTKSDVESIRHIFLDFDVDGNAAMERLMKRDDVPKPNHLTNTSPDKWQAIWKVSGFEPTEAERLQKGLARQTGADTAATDCSRVMRLPGFYNQKYSQRFMVRAEKHSDEVYDREHFPKFKDDEQGRRSGSSLQRPRNQDATVESQSERDWAYAVRSLRRGDPEDDIVRAIANHRKGEKYSPQQYAERTVQKAAASLAVEHETKPNR